MVKIKVESMASLPPALISPLIMKAQIKREYPSIRQHCAKSATLLQEIGCLCCNGKNSQQVLCITRKGKMAKLSKSALRQLLKGGETTTVELKIAAPRPIEMAERLCGVANRQGGMIIIGVEDAEHKIVGVPDERMAMTVDTILRAARQNIKLALDPPEPEVSVLDGKQVVGCYSTIE
jgi:hypothetical protein